MPGDIDHENFGTKGVALNTREARLIADQKAKGVERKTRLKPPVVKEKTFFEHMKTNRFLLVRGVYYIFYSVWTIVMGIGMFIAWLIAMLFI